MNRRGFLLRAVGAIAGILALPKLAQAKVSAYSPAVDYNHWPVGVGEAMLPEGSTISDQHGRAWDLTIETRRMPVNFTYWCGVTEQ